MAKSRNRSNAQKKILEEKKEAQAKLQVQEEQRFLDLEINLSTDSVTDEQQSSLITTSCLALPISDNSAKITKQKYACKLAEARETISRRNSSFRKAAIGTGLVTLYFQKITRELFCQIQIK
ncbi:hypothetical protein G6F56_010690 [Rhizopus delemar]|nr:hypothetical protein G6F56_010690 [Rhizopus delemar]